MRSFSKDLLKSRTFSNQRTLAISGGGSAGFPPQLDSRYDGATTWLDIREQDDGSTFAGGMPYCGPECATHDTKYGKAECGNRSQGGAELICYLVRTNGHILTIRHQMTNTQDAWKIINDLVPATSKDISLLKEP